MSGIKLRPSASGGWVYCNGMPIMQAGFPDNSTEASEEGNFAHELAVQMIEGVAPISGISQEIIRYVQMYVHDIIKTVKTIQTQLHIEETVSIPRIHPTCEGTPDAWCLDLKNMILYIWDLKYGYGIVEVFRNWQLICYALGIIDSIPGNLEQQLTVCFRIVQPRPHHDDGPIREWKVSATDLRPFGNQLNYAASMAHGENPQCKSGPWCKDCLALHGCKTAELAGWNAIDVIGSTQLSIKDPTALGHTMTALYRARKMADQMFIALEAQALEVEKKGNSVPGWAPTSGIGNRKWDRPDSDVFEFGQMMGVDLKKPEAPITPTQAIAAGIPEDMLKDYIIRGKSAIKLKPDNNQKAEEIFSKK